MPNNYSNTRKGLRGGNTKSVRGLWVNSVADICKILLLLFFEIIYWRRQWNSLFIRKIKDLLCVSKHFTYVIHYFLLFVTVWRIFTGYEHIHLCFEQIHLCFEQINLCFELIHVCFELICKYLEEIHLCLEEIFVFRTNSLTFRTNSLVLKISLMFFTSIYDLKLVKYNKLRRMN